MRHLNLANLLSLSRLVLAPFAVAAILAQDYRRALALFAVAGTTDAIDGPVARWLGSVSRLGAYLDPVADKALLSAGYLALGLAGAVPWWLVGLIFGRDLLILALVGWALLFTKHRDFPPSAAGKVSTIVQVVTGVVVMLDRGFAGWPISPQPLFWAAAAATVWSGGGYVARAWRIARRLGPRANSEDRRHRMKTAGRTALAEPCRAGAGGDAARRCQARDAAAFQVHSPGLTAPGTRGSLGEGRRLQSDALCSVSPLSARRLGGSGLWRLLRVVRLDLGARLCRRRLVPGERAPADGPGVSPARRNP
jgi:cardiolipin synthase